MARRRIVAQLDDAHRREELAPFLEAERPQRPLGRRIARRVDPHGREQRDPRGCRRLAPLRTGLIEILRNDANRVGQPFYGRLSNFRFHSLPFPYPLGPITTAPNGGNVSETDCG